MIIATNSSLEGGDYCDVYQQTDQTDRNQRSAGSQSGVPVGGDLEYIDEVTLLRALEGRIQHFR